MTIDGEEPKRLPRVQEIRTIAPKIHPLPYAGCTMKPVALLSSTLLVCVAATCMQAQTRVLKPNTGDKPPTGFARILPLWPGPAPLSKGTAPGDIPRLYYYPAVGPSVRSAVIVLPGGGYYHLVMNKEGAIEAKWLAAHGVAAFVLQYRLAPWYRYPVPMLDGARAVRYVRSHAAEFEIDPEKVGVWGFSAGGNLAAFLATEPFERDNSNPDPVERVSAHPNFAVFSYARFSMDDSIPRSNNMEALFGPHPTPEMLDSISYARHVTHETSPSFIYSTNADQTVNSLNSTAYYDALKRAGVPAELHIFELGPHGTGMGQNLNGLAELELWPALLENWMQLHRWMIEGSPER